MPGWVHVLRAWQVAPNIRYTSFHLAQTSALSDPMSNSPVRRTVPASPTNKVGAAVEYSYDSSSRLLSSTNGASYILDTDGNLIGVEGVGAPVTMSYDEENRAGWPGYRMRYPGF
jgi:hypothetical protein